MHLRYAGSSETSILIIDAAQSHGRSLCLRLAVDLRLCHIMIGSEKVSISAQELAASSNSEELLVGMSISQQASHLT